MMRRFALLIALSALPFATQQASAQRASAKGVVVDTTGTAIPDVQVIVSYATRPKNDTTRVIAKATTDASGKFTISGLPSGKPLVFMARKLGYTPIASKAVTLQSGEMQELEFQMEKSVLETVRVTAQRNKAYYIDSIAIAKLPVRNALGVVLNYRPRMLGDVYKECVNDTSHLTYESASFYRPPLTFRGNPTYYPPFRLFINGILHNEQGAKDILARLDADDISEMNYVDCWNKETPRLQNSLFVVLKPGREY
jgi:hypothetical protein